MDLNHETAMRLWVKSFGNKAKAIDFAGREIAKGAYNDRNSQFGWNVDHVLPQSRGGKTADYNLVCCHILTNDEKADKFPCFNANGKKFEIVKVQNHYEIKPVSATTLQATSVDDELNLYDSASGVRFFKRLKGIQNKKRFIGSVVIRLENLQNSAVVDFIEEIFDSENISFIPYRNNYYGLLVGGNGRNVSILVKSYDLPLQDDINDLLDKCVLLNTYLGHYFLALKYISNYEIDYAIECDESRFDIFEGKDAIPQRVGELANSLFINGLVIENTEAKDKVNATNGAFVEYNYVFSKLAENLRKEVEGK